MRKAYEVRWTRPAADDLERLLDFISNDSPRDSLAVLHRIRDAAENLKYFPERGRVVPELRALGIAPYREIVVTPWRIVYRIADRTVFVFAVVDGRRRIEDVLLDRLTLG